MKSLLAILALLVGIAVPLASFVTGLRSTDPLWLWKRPRLLARSLLVILVVVPLVAMLLAEVLSPANVLVRAGIVVSILSVGIGPPDLLSRTDEPKEIACYEIALDVALMTLVIVYLPAAVALHRTVFHHAVSVPWQNVAQVVSVQAILPYFAGFAFARWLPKLAARLERYAPHVVNGAMLIVAIVALIALWRSLLGLGAAAWLTCAAIAMVAILIGHLAGGPAGETRTVLATFSAMRFPALALLITSRLPRGAVLIPMVIAYVIVSALLVAVYRTATRLRVVRRAAVMHDH